MDCWVTGRCAAKLIGRRELLIFSVIDFSSDVNSVNKSSRTKHYVYSESDRTFNIQTHYDSAHEVTQ